MGALASLEQREEVRRSRQGAARRGPARLRRPGARRRGRRRRRARRVHVARCCCAATTPSRAEPHEVEAFGPVATIIGYRDTGDVIELAARGQGSLAGSVVTGDTGFARDVVLGVAPWHGRLLVLDRDDAAESTGHGSPLPALVHGGPGRAGGGEEMGGMRGVLHHMQRTAMQASPRMLAAVTGRWVPGAPRAHDGAHPFRKSLAELRIGDTVVAGPRAVTLADIEHFAEFTGDTFYAHMDEEAAARQPVLRRAGRARLPGLSFAAGLFVEPDPGPGAGQLRPGEPALPHPGLPGRRADRDADLQADHPARGRRATARCAGTPT